MLLDSIAASLNDDVKDVVTLLAVRICAWLGFVFDYATNPANAASTYNTTRTAIGNTYNAAYPAAAVSLNSATLFDSFVLRHGVGATNNAKWTSIITFLTTYKDFKPKVMRIYEEGSLKGLAELWYMRIAGDREYYDGGDYLPAADLVYTESRETVPGPTFNFIKERRWASASLGKAVRRVTTNTFDGTRVNRAEGLLEII